MNELTQLENEVITAILATLIPEQGELRRVVHSLPIADRTFSRDVTDQRKCVGFYLNLKHNSVLAGVHNVPHHLGVQASHSGMPAGGDFILFFSKDRTGIEFLEGTFFDYALSIDELVGNQHGFVLQPTSP